MVMRRDCANALRMLSIDAIEKAQSGHPGAPMGMADIAEVLWRDFLRHNPKNPMWWNRDRFVLSNGHASMLLYALLHLTGYTLSIDDLKSFRQLHAHTPGHPEWDTVGVETTTGPLGQGLANAVGMAIAEKVLRNTFNRPQYPIIDHFTYVFVGDGCLMEGISHEVCSLAGTLALGKLIVFYDDNGISIDGKVERWFTEDTEKRFHAYGWQVIGGVDGHSPDAIHQAVVTAQEEQQRPTLICCKTIIGFGSPHKSGSHKIHGSPLGEEETQEVRRFLGWDHPPFHIPEPLYQVWNRCDEGEKLEQEWECMYAAYKKDYPQLEVELRRRMLGKLPDCFMAKTEEHIHQFRQQKDKIATRKASQKVLDAYGQELPELLGGSADLTGSNLTFWQGCGAVTPEDTPGNYIFYGVREFGMSAIMNGMALYGGIIPYGGTFLVFMDYARNAVRMSALMKQQVIYVYTHDSIGVGEDGPTHQPVEHLVSLRAIPGLDVWRPCDLIETAAAWRCALQKGSKPSALIFSRQGLPSLTNDTALEDIEKGGYILKDCTEGDPDLILIATGSEVALAVQVHQTLTERGHKVRVVSMPCTQIYEDQPIRYREQVLPNHVRKRIAIEAGAPDGWYKYIGQEGRVLGMHTFGASGPGEKLFDYFALTASSLESAAIHLLHEKME